MYLNLVHEKVFISPKTPKYRKVICLMPMCDACDDKYHSEAVVIEFFGHASLDTTPRHMHEVSRVYPLFTLIAYLRPDRRACVSTLALR